MNRNKANVKSLYTYSIKDHLIHVIKSWVLFVIFSNSIFEFQLICSKINVGRMVFPRLRPSTQSEVRQRNIRNEIGYKSTNLSLPRAALHNSESVVMTSCIRHIYFFKIILISFLISTQKLNVKHHAMQPSLFIFIRVMKFTKTLLSLEFAIVQ